MDMEPWKQETLEKLSESIRREKAAVVVDIGAAALHSDGRLRIGDTGVVLSPRQAAALGRELVEWSARENARASRTAAAKAAAARRRS